jgi:hypothetical protein
MCSLLLLIRWTLPLVAVHDGCEQYRIEVGTWAMTAEPAMLIEPPEFAGR